MLSIYKCPFTYNKFNYIINLFDAQFCYKNRIYACIQCHHTISLILLFRYSLFDSLSLFSFYCFFISYCYIYLYFYSILFQFNNIYYIFWKIRIFNFFDLFFSRKYTYKFAYICKCGLNVKYKVLSSTSRNGLLVISQSDSNKSELDEFSSEGLIF